MDSLTDVKNWMTNVYARIDAALAEPVAGGAVATIVARDPHADIQDEGPFMSRADWLRLGALPVGTSLYVSAPSVVLESALRKIMEAHRFNVASLPVTDVHSICFDALTSSGYFNFSSEHAAFQAYAIAKGWEPHMLKRRSDNPDVYEDWGVQPEWCAWKARAALNGGAVAGQSDPCSWKDGQVLEFLGVALRNVELQGTVKLSEIRQGFEYMRDGRISVPTPICDCRQGRDACTCKGGE